MNMTNVKSRGWAVRIVLLIAIVALSGGVVGCGSSSSPSSPNSTAQGMGRAPDFTLITLTGVEITLSELKGMPVVVNFWATWCGPCVMEIGYIEAVAQQTKGKVKFVAVNIGESASRIQQFFGSYRPTFTVALDRDTKVFVQYSSTYNPRGYTPITFFVDREGIIQRVKIGAFSSEEEIMYHLDSIS